MAPRLAAMVFAAALLAGCQSDADPPQRPGPPGDVDIVGLWYLQETVIDGTESSVPSSTHMTLSVRPRGTQAHENCSYVELAPQVDADGVSFERVGDAGMALSCLTLSPRSPSPLPPGSYFKALDEVDRAQRVRDALVLSGSGITLVYKLQRELGER